MLVVVATDTATATATATLDDITAAAASNNMLKQKSRQCMNDYKPID